MKVIHVAETLESLAGGPGKSVPDLAAGLDRVGVELFLIATQLETEARYDVIEEYRLRFHPAKIPWPFRKGFFRRGFLAPSFLPRLWQESRDAELIHFTGLWTYTSLCVLLTAWRYSLPLVYSPRASLYPEALTQNVGRKRLARKLFGRRILDRVACVHATAEDEVDAVRASGVEKPIALVPNGVNTREFDSLLGPAAAREKLGLPTDRSYALFIGRIHPRKRLDWVVKVWAELHERFPEWDLLVVGPKEKGAYFAEVEAFIRDRGLEPRIRYLGYLERRERGFALAASDYFVVPTSFENFGTAIAEALAAGLPVITTRRAPWRAIQEREAGWWIDQSIDELRGAMEAVMSLSPEARLEMGRRGREIVESMSLERQGALMARVYEWVLGQGPKPECVV